MLRKILQYLWGLLVFATVVLTLPLAVEEGVAAWNRWGAIALNYLYPYLGPWGMLIPLVLGVSWWLFYYPPLWFDRITSDAANRPGWHDDLWSAQAALVEYRRSLSGGDLDKHAAKQALLPHLYALCRALDEMNIPHPPIDEGLFLLDNQAEWGDFIARLWAVRRDISLARKVYGVASRTAP